VPVVSPRDRVAEWELQFSHRQREEIHIPTDSSADHFCTTTKSENGEPSSKSDSLSSLKSKPYLLHSPISHVTLCGICKSSALERHFNPADMDGRVRFTTGAVVTT
jgi:hypothetical protein